MTRQCGCSAEDIDEIHCLHQQLACVLQLGYEVETEDSVRDVDAPGHDEMQWLEVWVIGEGWTRTQH